MIEPLFMFNIRFSCVFVFLYLVARVVNQVMLKNTFFTIRYRILKLVPVLSFLLILLQPGFELVGRNVTGILMKSDIMQGTGISNGGTMIPYIDFYYFHRYVCIFWGSGFLVFGARYLNHYRRFRNIFFKETKLVRSQLLEDVLDICKKKYGIQAPISIYYSSYASTPFICGIMKPRIIIPWGMIDNLPKMVNHELIHFKTGDIQKKAVVGMMKIFQWYNPFIYTYGNDLETYCEYACDEQMIQDMEFEERRCYGFLILSIAKNSSMKRTFYSAFASEKALSLRLNYLLHPMEKKLNKCLLMVGIVGVLLFAFTFSQMFHSFFFNSSEEQMRNIDYVQTKIIKVNFRPDKIPSAYEYEEYIDGYWWRGMLLPTKSREIMENLTEVVFEGTIKKNAE